MKHESNSGTLRDAIRAGLGEKWTQEAEDALFWPLSDFCDRVAKNAAESENERLHSAIGFLLPNVKDVPRR